jgi:biopolymer transport protein ExbD
MSKIKLPSKPPRIDMTPMVDLFFLLLTFFMLTTSFRPQEAVEVTTPPSISEKMAPDKNVITIFISKDNKVFYNIDNGGDSTMHIRPKVLQAVGKQLRVNFTPEQLSKFEKLASFGMPVTNLSKWIDAQDSKVKDALQTGIPIDSTDNQLTVWVLYSRQANKDAEVIIKGDSKADYKVVKRVLDIVQNNEVNKFNLTTTPEKVEVKLDNK